MLMIRATSLACIAAVLCALLAARARQPASSPAEINREAELNVKAAYIYSICKFVTWPTDAFPAPDQPLVIGVMGKPEILSRLEKVAGSRQAQDRRLTIRTIDKPADFAGCHLIYLGESLDAKGRAAALKALNTKPTVIVAESEGMGKQGAHFNFFLGPKANVLFEVNVRAAKASGLEFSPQLTALSMARLIQ